MSDVLDRLQKVAAKDPFQFPKSWTKKKDSKDWSDKSVQDLGMWRQWKSSGEDPDELQSLMTSLNPIITSRVNRQRAPRIHKPAIEAQARTLTVQALRRYDPTQKASISTHVYNNLKGLNRYVKKHQNFTRIVEIRAGKIGDYQRTKQTLKEELNREPTSHELADRLNMSVRNVERLQKELRPDIFTIPTPGLETNPFEEELPVHREIIEMLPYELSMDEKRVFDVLFGRSGQKEEKSTNKIAQRLGWSPSKVSQVKGSITRKYRSYMESF